MYGATWAFGLNTSKPSNKVCHSRHLPKHNSPAISGQVFGFISSCLSNRQLFVVLNGKTLQDLFMLGFLKAPLWVSLFYCYILIIVQIMLSVILLSLLKILFSTLNIMKLLHCSNSLSRIVDLSRK